MSMAPEDRGDAGFALLSVIGAMGIIAAIMTAFIAAARYRAIESFSISQRARAETVSDASVNATVARLLVLVSRGGFESDRPGLSGLSASCAYPDGTAVRVTVTHESGKVDLNAAQADLVAALIRGIVLDGQTRAVVRDILSLRGSRAGRKPQPAFESALQIGQIPGIGRREFEALLPLVTVHSGSPGLNARLASAEVLTAVSGQGNPGEAQRRNAAFFLADVPGPIVEITADAETEHGIRFSRTAIVEFLRERPVSFRIREWRDDSRASRLPPARNAPPC